MDAFSLVKAVKIVNVMVDLGINCSSREIVSLSSTTRTFDHKEKAEIFQHLKSLQKRIGGFLLT